MKILLTGINGFVGKALVNKLLQQGCEISGSVRSKEKKHLVLQNSAISVVGEINGQTDWKQALSGVDVVVHLAARVHVMHDSDVNSIDSYRLVNVAGTGRLAQQASEAGVKRFVYLSSIKVNGEERERPYTEEDLADPKDPYGVSKWEAEQLLRGISVESGVEVVIIRPPLVYGPGVKANFLRLLGWVKNGVPLPFGGLHNRRSMVYIGNLVGAISVCLEHPAAAGQTFLVNDGHDLSVTELLKMIAKEMGVRQKLLPIPSALLEMLAKLIGKSSESRRLTKSLCVDSCLIQKTLDWVPPYTVEEGIRDTVEWFKNR